MISILLPTRNRPAQLRRLVESINQTSAKRPEIILYIDSDDVESVPVAHELGLKYKVGPRMTLTQCWNELLPLTSGDILMQGNDDIVFRTKYWDTKVESAFASYPDRIVMVHGSDGGDCNGQFGPHPFVHRRWVETIGYFIPPYFSSDYGDTWLNDVANMLGRRVYIPIVVEHMHHIYAKADMDQTTKDRLVRHGEDNVVELYKSLFQHRANDAHQLAQKFNTPAPIYDQKVKWTIMILTQPSRVQFLKRLRATLDPQVFSHWGVQVDVRMFDPQFTLGQNRQIMREEARGEYSCFIDDDDLIAPDYVEKMFPLLDGIDYVGFQLQCFVDGEKLLPTFHSLKYSHWFSDGKGYYRDLSHLNPIKTDLALKASMEGGFGEDSRWSDNLRKLDIVKTEHYVVEPMYFYYCRTVKNDTQYFFDGVSIAPKIPAIIQPLYTPPKLVCPGCQATCVVVFSNGHRCNQCGKQF